MKILHTADWHIGQSFYAYDRTYEHRQFLNWLQHTLKKEAIDVLLISGDVFDLSNPSAASVRLFYHFLNNAIKSCPDLQIIVTAGNHDSAARLESPSPLLESSNIHIIGLVKKDASGEIDYENLAIPLKNKAGEIQAWCLAIPFLRMGDYPAVPGSKNPYVDGVKALYQEACVYISKKKNADQVVIAMGHLHAQKASVSDMDSQERLIMGGVEGIPVTAFPEGFIYVALGHIHKAQRIAGRENIRYSGSPLPMSFSELRYKHQMVVFTLGEVEIKEIKTIEIPVSVPLKRVPHDHRPIKEVLRELKELPSVEHKDDERAPYLEVRVLLDGPEPAIRHKVEEALTGKYARLAKIDVHYKIEKEQKEKNKFKVPDELEKLHPEDVFKKVYRAQYGGEVPDSLEKLFSQAVRESAINKD